MKRQAGLRQPCDQLVAGRPEERRTLKSQFEGSSPAKYPLPCGSQMSPTYARKPQCREQARSQQLFPSVAWALVTAGSFSDSGPMVCVEAVMMELGAEPSRRWPKEGCG